MAADWAAQRLCSARSPPPGRGMRRGDGFWMPTALCVLVVQLGFSHHALAPMGCIPHPAAWPSNRLLFAFRFGYLVRYIGAVSTHIETRGLQPRCVSSSPCTRRCLCSCCPGSRHVDASVGVALIHVLQLLRTNVLADVYADVVDHVGASVGIAFMHVRQFARHAADHHTVVRGGDDLRLHLHRVACGRPSCGSAQGGVHLCRHLHSVARHRPSSGGRPAQAARWRRGCSTPQPPSPTLTRWQFRDSIQRPPRPSGEVAAQMFDPLAAHHFRVIAWNLAPGI